MKRKYSVAYGPAGDKAMFSLDKMTLIILILFILLVLLLWILI
jgi:hypothetical protein